MDEVEFTPDELAILEGKDLEEEVHVELDQYGEPVPQDIPEEVAPIDVPEGRKLDGSSDVSDQKEEGEKEELSEVDQLKRANAGLLNDLRGTRKELKEAREWRTGIESRLDKLAAAKEPEVAEEDAEPNREESPLDWIAWKSRQNVKEELQPIKEQQAKKEEQEKFAAAEQRVFDATQKSQEAYLEREGLPQEAFNERMGQLREQRFKWHVAEGMDPETALAKLVNEERGFIYDAISKGEDPATEAMRLWSMMIGDGNEQSTPEAKTPTTPSAFDKAEAARKGQTTAGLSDLPGGASGIRVTRDQFANLDSDDPIALKIYNSDKLMQKMEVHGEVFV